MKVLVTGSRNWTDKQLIFDILETLGTPLTVVHGGNGYLKSGKACKTKADLMQATVGADALAHQAAEELGADVDVHWANWSVGLRAGPQRNSEMLATKPDAVLAFHDDLARSKGTGDMVSKAAVVGIEVILIAH